MTLPLFPLLKSLLCVSRPSFHFGGNNLCASICAPANVKEGCHTRHVHATAAVVEVKCGDASGIAIPSSGLLLKLSSKALDALDAPKQKKLREDFDALIKAFEKVHSSTLAIIPTDALEGKLMYFSNHDELVSIQKHNTRFSGHTASDAVEADVFFLNPAMAKIGPPSPEIEPLPLPPLPKKIKLDQTELPW